MEERTAYTVNINVGQESIRGFESALKKFQLEKELGYRLDWTLNESIWIDRFGLIHELEDGACCTFYHSPHGYPYTLSDLINHIISLEELINNHPYVEKFGVVFNCNQNRHLSNTYLFLPVSNDALNPNNVGIEYPYPWKFDKKFVYEVAKIGWFKSVFHLSYLMEEILRDCEQASWVPF